MEIKCKKGKTKEAQALKRGRPKHIGSYRQRFFTALDALEIMEYLEIDVEDRDKAIAYCYQKNATTTGKRFAVNSLAAGAVRVIREN